MATTSLPDAARLVICGSMRAWNDMRRVQQVLDQHGICSLIPDTDEIVPHASSAEMNEVKRAASLRHFEYIQSHHTTAVLVVNVTKDGQDDYIGPNAFAEIAVAVASGRPVYLLNGMPSAYSDELRAWGARELHGELDLLADEFRSAESAYAHAS